ncbi:MAG: chemotaxis protein CheR [Snowella sp.]|jgi:chemotaxis protein methyltransferase CheR|nr:MAG: chemotaxis protein CheR [Snowella sp.]
MTETISPSLREDFVSLIAKQTGIEIRAQNYGSMGDNIFTRMKALKLVSPQAYYNLLVSFTPDSEEEWQKFVCLVTNRESYFFRDKGQFSLLRNTILPELIRRNQRTKTLRVCSAGCSTGQEPYSIAILLRELIPELTQWNLTILGIDINRESLDHGKKALYNTWSFRQVEDDIKARYFKNLAGYYQLNEEIRPLVKFHQVNLTRDPFPRLNSELRDMDLIICRNVFIYFTDQAIGQVVEKFFQTLKPNGYLMSGHAELGNHHVKAFQAKLFPESVLYQRRTGDFSQLSSQPTLSKSYKPASPPLDIPIPEREETKPMVAQTTTFFPVAPVITPNKTIPRQVNPKTPGLVSTTTKAPVNSDEEALLKEVEQLVKHKSYHLAQTKLEQILKRSPNHFRSAYLMAELQANLGNYEQAKKWCQTAIGLNAFAANPHHLIAHIEEEQGNFEEAKKALKTIIYLEPNGVAAYISLGNLYQREGDFSRSQKMQQSALKILQTLPQETKISELGNISVEALISELQNSL